MAGRCARERCSAPAVLFSIAWASPMASVILRRAGDPGGAMAKTPRVGEQAPDFELQGTDGSFRLSEHRGERVVLLFYPGDNTPVCTKQFCSYRDHPDEFAALGAT